MSKKWSTVAALLVVGMTLGSYTNTFANPKDKNPNNWSHGVVVTDGGVALLRQAPDKNGKVVAKLPRSERVFWIDRTKNCEVIAGKEGCWSKVKVKRTGQVGYIFDAYMLDDVEAIENEADENNPEVFAD